MPPSNFEPQCVAPVGNLVGEGAVWDAQEKAVFWTDVCRFLILRLDFETFSIHSWQFTEPVVALALTNEPGRLLVALGSKLVWWWPQTDRRMDQGFHLANYPQVRFNDGRADPRGNFWVGSMQNNVKPNGDVFAAGGTAGKMFRVANLVTEWIAGLGISNTVCFSPDQKIFYTADTLANTVWAYAYDPKTANLGLRRDFLKDFERGLPDGSAVDAEGYLWNCRYGGSCLVRIAPSGQVDRVVDMPVTNVTTAVFGGPDLKTLFVTSAAIEHLPGERLAGSLWAFKTEVPGLPENIVQL